MTLKNLKAAAEAEFPPQQEEKCAYFHNEGDVCGESLHSVETSDEPNGQKALLIHLPPQKKVPFQVVQAEVVLTTDRNTSSTSFQR